MASGLAERSPRFHRVVACAARGEFIRQGTLRPPVVHEAVTGASYGARRLP
jgi:hypothetical protein